METNNNENLKAEECKAKSWAVRPPQTRLQKQAPAALQLDQMVVDGETDNPCDARLEEAAPSCRAIPLLSPLVLSPMRLREREEEEQLIIPAAVRSSSGSIIGDETTITPPQSPDSEAFPEASALFSFFQAQCALVNRSQ